MYTKTKTLAHALFLMLARVAILSISAEAPAQAQAIQLSVTATPAVVQPGQSVTITATTNTNYDTSANKLSVAIAYKGNIIHDTVSTIVMTPKTSIYEWSVANADQVGAYAVTASLAPITTPTSPSATAQTTVTVGTGVTNGACGSANGQVTAKAPTTNLCAAGVASQVAAYTGFAAEGVWAWTCDGSSGGSTASCAGTNTLPSRVAQFTFDFTDDSAVAAFLQGNKQPNVNYVIPINYQALGPVIKAKGYKVQEALAGYAAQWVQGYVAGYGPLPAATQNIYAVIDRQVASGVTMIWIGEIYTAPGDNDWFSPTSIAYNVRGVNMLYDYIHTKHPGVLFGLSMGDGQGPALHLALLKAGMKEDFAQLELYELGINGPSLFLTSGLTAQFPNVKTAVLAYGTVTLCSDYGKNWLDPTQIDYISYWDVNNNGNFMGPWLDASWQQNALTFAATGERPFCELPNSYSLFHTWTPQTL